MNLFSTLVTLSLSDSSAVINYRYLRAQHLREASNPISSILSIDAN